MYSSSCAGTVMPDVRDASYAMYAKSSIPRPSAICETLRLYLRSHATIVIRFVDTVTCVSSLNVAFSVSCMRVPSRLVLRC